MNESLAARSTEVDAVVEAIRARKLVILPTDTVYGLCATPYSSGPADEIYRVKRRPETQPLALVACNVDMLFELVPELRGRSGRIVTTLLPGPYTLVLPNPGRRYSWLTASNPHTLGVRVPELAGPGAAVLQHVDAVAATSANLSGGREPARLADVPAEVRSACAAEIDGGELPGRPSTVLDFTLPQPRVLREGAGPADEALARVAALA